MMINSFGTSMPMMPTSVNRATVAPTQISTQPSLLSAVSPISQPLPSRGTTNAGGWNLMSTLNNWTSNVGQMAGNTLQTVGNNLGNAFGSFGQLGAGALFSVVSPSINFLQNLNTQRPVQNVQPTGGITQTTPQQIFQSVSSGANQALQDIGTLLTQNAPAMMAYGGSMAGAGAVCPYASAGMAATGAAMLLSQNNGQSV